MSTSLLFSSNDTTELTTENFSPEKFNINTYTLKTGGFVQDNWQLTDILFFNYGARIDYFRMNNEITLSPRFSCSVST